MKKKDLPIGYWIRRVDNLLAEGIDKIHVVHGINRTDWQILHSIKQETSLAMKSLTEIMQPFAAETDLRSSLEKMIGKGWITGMQETYSLTVSGDVFYEDCLQLQTQFRKKATQGIDPDSYETTMNTLQKIAANLGE